MKLLIETNTENLQIITESVNGAKQYFLEGVFLQSEIQNKNGRMYPKKVLNESVQTYIKEYINTDRALGELGHPENASINLDRVSHKIVSLREDGNSWIGKAKVLSTPFGKIVQNLMDDGVKLGVSLRALGSIKESNGVRVVQNDLRLVTPADIVADPSAPDAFVQNLMENKEWIFVDGILVEQQITEVKNDINKLSKSNKLNEAALLAVFNKVLSKF